ncbi:S1 family peptidase [Pseudoroseomonas ludipueritiae]|uniref:S1 family peptidase n=1 Tax=Pseudoroseomonas ludipueritiae TaxID=198093 RepID=UPI001932A8E4|nr:serine protease [Pseudoroseomonas ludipueritiae]
MFRSVALRFNKSFPDRTIAVVPTSAELRDRSVWILDNVYNEQGDELQGTAFFLKDVGLVTAAHCVESAKEVEVFHPSKRANMFTATVMKVDVDRDLAILSHSIPQTEFFELEMSPRPAATGDATVAVGYPGFRPGDSLNVREGKVQSLAVRPEKRLIEVSQKLTQGMSGGPLLDSASGVIGVIHKGGPGEGRDFAVNISALVAWLAE